MDWKEIHQAMEDELFEEISDDDLDVTVLNPSRYHSLKFPECKNKFLKENLWYCYVIHSIVEYNDISTFQFSIEFVVLNQDKTFIKHENDFVKCALDMNKPEFAEIIKETTTYYIVRYGYVELLENREFSAYIDDLIKFAINNKQYEVQTYLIDYKYKHNLFQKKELELI